MDSIFEADDYRVVLKRHLDAMVRQGSGGPSSRLARQAGITPGHLRNILTGRRKLLPRHLEGFVGALELRGEEAEYFRALVRAVHAPTAAERATAADMVQQIRLRNGLPRPRAQGRAPRPPRSESSAAAEADARFLALFTRPWVSLGLPATTASIAAQLDEACPEPRLARALRYNPELSRPLSPQEPLPALHADDPIGARALGDVLRVLRKRVHGLRPPDRALDTTHALVCADDLPTLAAALDAAWDAVSVEVRALSRRAEAATGDGPVGLHLLGACFSLQTPAFSTHHTQIFKYQIFSDPTPERGPESAQVETGPGSELPSPFDHLELVTYLSAWLDARRQRTPRFSLTTFARRARCSTGHVHQVFRGMRRLTDEYLPGFAVALGLQGPEALYLGLLTSLSNTTSVGHRAQLLRQMSAMHMQRQAPMPQGLAFSTLMDPLHLIVFEAASAPGFRDDPGWIARALGIAEPEAEAALWALRRAQLLTSNGEGGFQSANLNFALSADLAGPPVELAQLQVLDRVIAEGNYASGHALGLALRPDDRVLLDKLVAHFYRELHLVLYECNRRAISAAGPYVVVTAQVIAAPSSRLLRARSAPGL